jgi:DNA-binding NarL/FixJ family response regulator
MKILIVDDHVLIRDALRSVLTQLKNDAAIFEAANGAQCLMLVEQHPDLDLTLLDLALPDRDGFSVLAELRERYATVAVVVLSALQERDTIRLALELGAVGFIPKTTERGVMLSAFQLIFSGGVYIPKEILDGAAPQPLASGDQGPARRELLIRAGMTERQIDVLMLMMQGKSNKTIAHALNMAEPTVKNHVTVILKTLKAVNRTEAVIKVEQMAREPALKAVR